MTSSPLYGALGSDGMGPFSQAKIPAVDDGQVVSNARLIAELQAITIGIHLVGLERLPTVMGPRAPINGAAK